jgi:hypothetical protein
MRSLDCYFHGISNCHIDASKVKLSSESVDHDDRTTTFGRMLPAQGADICTVARLTKKSIAWVAGQYLSYIVRPRYEILEEISQRNSQIFDGVDRRHYSTITVHYRAGKPDFARNVPSLDSYMEAVHLKAAELATDGRPVALVYLASQDNDHVFKNESYMKEVYGGNFTYKFLPTTKTPPINTSEEIELELKKYPSIPKKPFVLEFLADFHLMVKADCFIGSISTIYMISMLLRYARHPLRKQKYTCLVSDTSDLICEDDNRKHKIYGDYNYWILGNGAGGEDRYGAFKGGVPF